LAARENGVARSPCATVVKVVEIGLCKSGFQSYTVDTDNSATHENRIKDSLAVSAASISGVGVIWKNPVIIIEKTIEIALDSISCGVHIETSRGIKSKVAATVRVSICAGHNIVICIIIEAVPVSVIRASIANDRSRSYSDNSAARILLIFCAGKGRYRKQGQTREVKIFHNFAAPKKTDNLK
jgi:hypothetical protein